MWDINATVNDEHGVVDSRNAEVVARCSYGQCVLLEKAKKISVHGVNDSTAKMWDISTGNLVKTFKGHEGHEYGVKSVFVSGDSCLRGLIPLRRCGISIDSK